MPLSDEVTCRAGAGLAMRSVVLRTCRLVALLLAVLVSHRGALAAERIVAADLLIVGGTEAGVAATVQAARLGVSRIVLVNDIDWLGGQFSAEAVGAVDEWTLYRGKHVNFPRSGLFLEVMRHIRRYNGATYGLPSPGNAVTASDTIEPAAAARIFAEILAPFAEKGTGQVQLLHPYHPVKVQVVENRVVSVAFERGTDDRLLVQARLTIDASDWGDVIRLSGAKYAAAPDRHERFAEEHAPAGPLGEHRNEMNPLTYCLVLRETGKDATIPKPPGYDERRYFGTCGLTAQEFAAVGWPKGVWQGRTPPFVDSAYPEGIYSSNTTPYTQRRLVDRHHNRLPEGTEKILLNWPVQDYPVYNFPGPVADALEATEKGASAKNIVDMTPSQRRLVFDDAKRHSLGMLYHLQTTVHDKSRKNGPTFKQLELTDEFGTPDRLPPKPYVREGLRLEALYMLREQDLRMRGREPGWARVMVPDSIFAFQFNIDFHPTRRVFLKDDRSGPWANVHTANRNWSLHTDRAAFPYRGLVPVEREGLLGASKNIGVSSIVASAVRLHGQMMLTGQAAGTAAAICLHGGISPRDLCRSGQRLRKLQETLARGAQGAPGVLLWPYHDVDPDESHFEAVNMLAVRGIFTGDSDSVDFQPWRSVRRRELARTLARAARSLENAKPYHLHDSPLFKDVAANDPDRVFIESLQHWGALGAAAAEFRPDEVADWNTFNLWWKELGGKANDGLARSGRLPLTRAEMVRWVWVGIKEQSEAFPDLTRYLKPGHDADEDGIPDLDDPLPFDRDNDNVPDRLDPKP